MRFKILKYTKILFRITVKPEVEAQHTHTSIRVHLSLFCSALIAALMPDLEWVY